MLTAFSMYNSILFEEKSKWLVYLTEII